MKWITVIMLAFFLTSASSQNLVVDGAPVLLPRLTSAERDQVVGLEGMLIFNSDEGKFQGFVGGGDIESAPHSAGMQLSLGQYYLVWTPTVSGELTSIELYSESGGNLGDLIISTSTPCTEPNSLATSSMVNSMTGWNVYTFAPNPTLNAGNTYYIFVNTGTVTANLSQSDISGLGLGLWDGGSNCSGQAGELAIKIHLQGNWTDLH